MSIRSCFYKKTVKLIVGLFAVILGKIKMRKTYRTYLKKQLSEKATQTIIHKFYEDILVKY